MSYIDREAAIRAIENDCLEAVYYTKRDAIDSILAQPLADVVEVVRCRDCKLRYTEGCPMMAWDCGELMGETEDNDYCSYGERRSENGKS